MSDEESNQLGRLTRSSLRALISETIDELYDARLSESLRNAGRAEFVSVADDVMREVRELSSTRAQDNTNINKSIHKDQKRSISGAGETYLDDQVPQSLIDIARDIKQRK